LRGMVSRLTLTASVATLAFEYMLGEQLKQRRFRVLDQQLITCRGAR
jgi:hypothetical protein